MTGILPVKTELGLVEIIGANTNNKELESLKKRVAEELGGNGSWDSDIPLGGNSISCNFHAVPYQNLQMLLEKIGGIEHSEEDFDVPGPNKEQIYKGHLYIEGIGQALLEIAIAAWHFGRGPKATIDFSISLPNAEKQKLKKLHNTLLNYCGSKGERVRSPSCHVGDTLLKSLSIANDKTECKLSLEYISADIRTIYELSRKQDREILTFSSEFAPRDRDWHGGVVYKSCFKEKGLEQLLRKRFGEPAEIRISPVERIGIIANNKLIPPYADFINYVAKEIANKRKQTLYINFVNPNILWFARIVKDKGTQRVEYGVFLDYLEPSLNMEYIKRDIAGLRRLYAKIRRLYTETLPKVDIKRESIGVDYDDNIKALDEMLKSSTDKFKRRKKTISTGTYKIEVKEKEDGYYVYLPEPSNVSIQQDGNHSVIFYQGGEEQMRVLKVLDNTNYNEVKKVALGLFTEELHKRYAPQFPDLGISLNKPPLLIR